MDRLTETSMQGFRIINYREGESATKLCGSIAVMLLAIVENMYLYSTVSFSPAVLIFRYCLAPLCLCVMLLIKIILQNIC